jgi:hypothetical protein
LALADPEATSGVSRARPEDLGCEAPSDAQEAEPRIPERTFKFAHFLTVDRVT